MATLYLIQFDLSTNSHTLLDSQTVVCDGEPQHFELVSLRKISDTDFTLYSISYKNTLFSCNIVDNKFCNYQKVVVNPDERYHGVLAFGTDTVYVTNMRRPSITEYNVKSGATKSIVCSGGTRMKDAAILDDDHIIVISSDNGPIIGTRTPSGVSPLNPPFDSHIMIYNKHTTKLLARHRLPHVQIDGCIYHAPHCFVTCSRTDGTGYIWRATINSSYQFTLPKELPCAGFPHGLSLRGSTFAYTSYSESALYITDVGSFGLLD
jgi:hypothetical protein